MGTPIPPERKPDPVPAGHDCDICWGIGKPLGGGPPPSQVIATFEGVEKGQFWSECNGEPLDGDYTLQQEDEAPCYWTFWDGPGSVEWYHAYGKSIIFSHSSEGPVCIIVYADECTTLFINTDDVRFKGGSVKITLPGIEE